MTHYSAFFVSLVAAMLLWDTGQHVLFGVTVGLAVVSAVLSGISRIYAIKQAKERRNKAVTGLRLRKRPPEEIDEMKKKPLKLIESDYDFVPPWITYAGMAIALVSVLILGYAAVIRFAV